MAETARFLHVAFKWDKVSKEKELEPILNTARDWAKYAPNCWVLWSARGVDEWLKYIKPKLGPGDNVVICEVNFNEAGKSYTGWADKWFWDWIQKERL